MPLPRWWWRLVCAGVPLFPGVGAYERAVVRFVERRVAEVGGELLGSPVTSVREVGGEFVIRAECYALCPPAAATCPDVEGPA